MRRLDRQANGDTADAATYQSTAQSWASQLDSLTYATTGRSGTATIPADHPGRQAGRGHLDRHRQRRRQPRRPDRGRPQLPGAGAARRHRPERHRDRRLAVRDRRPDPVSTPPGPVWHRYDFDGYGETASVDDYTGPASATPGRSCPVSAPSTTSPADTSGAQSLLQTMAGAANTGHRSPSRSGRLHRHRRLHLGQPDNPPPP